jgi:hypothetical protein
MQRTPRLLLFPRKWIMPTTWSLSLQGWLRTSFLKVNR